MSSKLDKSKSEKVVAEEQQGEQGADTRLGQHEDHRPGGAAPRGMARLARPPDPDEQHNDGHERDAAP